jgi:hypothetical protein
MRTISYGRFSFSCLSSKESSRRFRYKCLVSSHLQASNPAEQADFPAKLFIAPAHSKPAPFGEADFPAKPADFSLRHVLIR